MSIYTVGHSNISTEDFLSLTKGIPLLGDVRSHPHSSYAPQYNGPEMERWSEKAGREYLWLPDLGGWTAKHASLAPQFAKYGLELERYALGYFPKDYIARKRKAKTDKPEWTSQGFYDYSFVMMTEEWLNAADRLASICGEGPQFDIAIFCSEALWWKCHRSMICDYLFAVRGKDSIHILPDGKRKLHSVALGNRIERYHPDIIDAWGERAAEVPSISLLDPSFRDRCFAKV